MTVEPAIKVKSDVWVPATKGNEREVFELAHVDSIDDDAKTCSVRVGKGAAVSLPYDKVQLSNPRVVPDMTSLYHINDAGILHNLKARSEKDLPYTNMGSVLVSVNPLHHIPDPDLEEGKAFPLDVPHPYAIAEGAFKNMMFSYERRAQMERQIEMLERGGADVTDESQLEMVVNQSVVISGESGSGKTEASKRVLHHLVTRASERVIEADKEKTLDRRLYGVGPILEAFGNASTVCNHNSSRFGKFSKLHFAQRSQNGAQRKRWELVGASVETYLLEMSRVVSHVNGERNFHIFHMLLSGADEKMRQRFGLPSKTDASQLRYMCAGSSAAAASSNTATTSTRGRRQSRRGLLGSPSAPSQNRHVIKLAPEVILKRDLANFSELQKALLAIGKSQDGIEHLLGTVAGILHLGNIEFLGDEAQSSDAAKHDTSKASSAQGLKFASKLLGLPEAELLNLLLTRQVKAGFETITAQLNPENASYARDALAKWTYSNLFDWIVGEINHSLLSEYREEEPVGDLPFIGVLDIFGFESFAKNGFEQLLINYTNESLQSTFNYQVFVAEADLYKREGLILADAPFQCPAEDGDCLDLLEGKVGVPGLLTEIDTVARGPQPSDDKLNRRLHTAFKGAASFPKPHPKDVATTFKVQHYAGVVTYTVGSFVSKNNDRIPDNMNTCMTRSTNTIAKASFERADGKRAGGPRKGVTKTVVANFSKQIRGLVETLESTKCSFIRCVKPNPEMQWARGTNWFNCQYVNEQLNCLSIPQTAAVLKSGFPTRISYDAIVSAYHSALPADALAVWKRKGSSNEDGGGSSSRAFCAALFWAFRVPQEAFRLGLTKVFFSSGMIDLLDRIMAEAANWSTVNGEDAPEKIEVGKRFKLYYARLAWRRCFAKVVATNKFIRLLHMSRAHGRAVRTIQKMVRAHIFRKTLEKRINKRRTREQQKRELERQEAEKKAKAEKEAAERKALEEGTLSRAQAAARFDDNNKKPSLNLETVSKGLPPTGAQGQSFRKQYRSGKVLSNTFNMANVKTPRGSIAPEFLEIVKQAQGEVLAENRELADTNKQLQSDLEALKDDIALLKKSMPHMLTHILHIY